jgi:hypothetical protein
VAPSLGLQRHGCDGRVKHKEAGELRGGWGPATQAGRRRELGGASTAALGSVVVETYAGNGVGEVSGKLMPVV